MARRSKYLSIDFEDVIRSIRLAFSSVIVTTVIPSIIDILKSGRFPNRFDWQSIGITAMGTAFGYLFVKYFTNSKDQFARRELTS